jgi:ABC-type lipoprotein export system ATPase subunit
MTETVNNLKVDSLTKIFPHPSKEAVNISLFANTSFQMSSETVNFLVGPSGSGKSTLLRILMGIESFDAGEVFINQSQLNNLQGLAKRQFLGTVGFMDQFPAKYLFMNESISFNLHYTLKLYKKGHTKEERQRRIVEIAELFTFADKLDRRLAVLSGGELRRVSLACAIITEPILLLCDEPSAHLDQAIKHNLMEAINKAKNVHDTLIIIATHDRSLLSHGLVYEIEDRRIHLVSGKND